MVIDTYCWFCLFLEYCWMGGRYFRGSLAILCYKGISTYLAVLPNLVLFLCLNWVEGIILSFILWALGGSDVPYLKLVVPHLFWLVNIDAKFLGFAGNFRHVEASQWYSIEFWSSYMYLNEENKEPHPYPLFGHQGTASANSSPGIT